MNIQKLLSPVSPAVENEFVEALVTSPGARIERIVSRGHRSPDDFWYDQDEDEWVLILTGRARLVFEDEAGEIPLGPGDALWIPAHRRHRVVWTDPDRDTVWVAVFLKP